MNIINNLAFLLLLQFSFASDQALEFPQLSPLPDSLQKPNINKSGAVNIVFKSTDGGQTWQDISEGLPGNLQADGLRIDDLFANDSGLHLRARGNGIYHNNQNSTAPFWEKEISSPIQGCIATDRGWMFAYNNDSQFLQKINGMSLWLPMYTNFQQKEVNTVFETTGGTVFIGTDNGLFKSTNSGATWKQVHTGDWAMKLVESNGILLAAGQRGILRSTDDGENWNWVISEGGVGIAVEPIKGGFAAITYNTASKTRRMRTSYDGGKTWQPIDTGLPANLSITSIIQVGEDFFCGHPAGVYRSSDKGKTWKLLLPSIEEKVFNLSVSGNVIYAVPVNAGC